MSSSERVKPQQDQTFCPLDQFTNQLSEMDAKNVNIGVFDRNGVFRHKRVDREKAIKMAKQGYPFCDVLYHWDTAESVYTEGAFEDKEASIDLTSLRKWPFGQPDALCIADFDGEFGELSARKQLKRQLQRADEMDICVQSAFEFEFSLFEETSQSIRDKGFQNLSHFAPANRTYSMRTSVECGTLLDEFADHLAILDILFDAIHTELGPGCFEIPLKHSAGIKSADDAALFKNFAKAFFAQRELTACFMSKVFDHLPGQSGHLHLSLIDKKTGKPLFHHNQDQHGLAEHARFFIGGVLKVLPEWLALCSHTTNAYRRLTPGAWAPTHASWGIQNRTSAVRVITGAPEETRIEFRVPSADTNPYSALSLLLAAGLNGIEQKTNPEGMRSDNCYVGHVHKKHRFPRDLGCAADRLDKSKSARATFGSAFIDNFVEACRIEDAAHRAHVSAFERQRYLEVV